MLRHVGCGWDPRRPRIVHWVGRIVSSAAIIDGDSLWCANPGFVAFRGRLCTVSTPKPCRGPPQGLATPPSAISSTSGESETGSMAESSSYSSDEYLSDDDTSGPSESSQFLSEPEHCLPPCFAAAVVEHRRG
jgi:hypothetical protein